MIDTTTSCAPQHNECVLRVNPNIKRETPLYLTCEVCGKSYEIKPLTEFKVVEHNLTISDFLANYKASDMTTTKWAMTPEESVLRVCRSDIGKELAGSPEKTSLLTDLFIEKEIISNSYRQHESRNASPSDIADKLLDNSYLLIQFNYGAFKDFIECLHNAGATTSALKLVSEYKKHK